MRKLLLFSCLLVSSLSLAQLTQQNKVLATGGNTYSDGTTVIDFTFGETFTSTLNPNSGLVLTQGFQQPTKRRLTTELQPSTDSFADIAELEGYDVNVYPNPFLNNLIIEIPEYRAPELFIYDNAGRLILSMRLTDVQTNLDLSEIAYGNYQLLLQDEDQLVARISVVKTF